MNTKSCSPNDADAPDPLRSTRTGRVAQDERGHAIWEWQTQPGVFRRDVTWQEVQALSQTDLALIDAPNRCGKFEGLWIHDSHR